MIGYVISNATYTDLVTYFPFYPPPYILYKNSNSASKQCLWKTCLFYSSQESVLNLLQELKQICAKLELQKHELEKADDIPENTDVSPMRKQLLQFYNTIREAEERDFDMLYKLE